MKKHTTTKKIEAVCIWCESPFTKTPMTINKITCSKECARERSNSRVKYIKKEPEVKVGLDYADYEDHTGELLDKYGVKVVDSTYEDRRGGEKIAVPEISFKRFKEDKNVFVFGQKRDQQRSEWV